ncbi:hypothetical protein B6U98_05805 [Thermoplasmatales archaeon ex4572_165]|nr:MAG: hypothetical protein B6U98_05805 [Thermoplasmatales archaeon ex4572_165]
MGKKNIISIILAAIIVSSIVFIYFFINQNSDVNYDQELLEFKQRVREDLKKFNMIKRLKDNKGILEPKSNFTKTERLSYYQTFVTPNHPAVNSYIQSNSLTGVIDAYNAAVSWTWVSDFTMHGTTEKWLKPKDFILNTSNKTLYPNNPVDGMASDCESQAYTLVSFLETLGISKKHVRVCIGLVDFGSGSGGHAWVQVFSNNRWYELEPTSGPYWDDETNQLINSSGVEIDYFKTRPYPVEEYWAFFNDVYYYNPSDGVKSSNLPDHWLTTEKHFKLSDLRVDIN